MRRLVAPLCLALVGLALVGVGADPAAAAGPDFRVYVFAAYGAVLVLLFLFTLWSVRQVRATGRKLERLEKRLALLGPPASDVGSTGAAGERRG